MKLLNAVQLALIVLTMGVATHTVVHTGKCHQTWQSKAETAKATYASIPGRGQERSL